MTSAQGQDRSAYQAVYSWKGLSFGFAKATNGLGLVDGNFAANWANMASEGVARGAYHELTATSSATAQAAFFVSTVRAHGLRPRDMLAVVASDYAGVTSGDVKAFCDAVRRLVGPHCPVIVYTDLSVARILGSCTGYPLWIAWPSSTAPSDVAPWRKWTFWQWGETGVDRDAFNGDTAALHAWLASYDSTPPPPPKGTVTMQITLPVLEQGMSDPVNDWAIVRRAQGLIRGVGLAWDVDVMKLTLDGDFGPATKAAVEEFQRHMGQKVTGVIDGATWPALIGSH